ncbi:uncharacterized protein AAG666_025926 isoform 1-T8 [Megaptera novaeangliae]
MHLTPRSGSEKWASCHTPKCTLQMGQLKAGGPAAALSMLVYQPHPCSLSPCPSQPNLPEDLLEELPHDRAEEETLSNTKVASRTSEKAPPEGLVEELPRHRAEEESPFNAKVASGVTENGWYSGINHLLGEKRLMIRKVGFVFWLSSGEPP